MANPLTSTADDGFLENLREADYAELSQNIWEAARDEFLGIDDFRRAYKNLMKGNLKGFLKSFGAGALELGGTVAMFTPAAPVAAPLKGLTVAGKAAKVGSKAGKLRNLGRLTKPLSLSEQVAGRAAIRAGAKRGVLGAPDIANITDEVMERARKEVLAEVVGQKPASRIIAQADEGLRRSWQDPTAMPGIGAATKTKLGDRPVRQIAGGIGSGRGGIGGSGLRAVLQATGQMPSGQGLLAKRAYEARLLGRDPSLLAKTGEFASGKLGTVAARTELDPFDVAAQAMAGPAMTPYGITQQQYDLYRRNLTPQEFNMLLTALQQQQQVSGEM